MNVCSFDDDSEIHLQLLNVGCAALKCPANWTSPNSRQTIRD